MKSSTHEACIFALESTVEIAQNCCIPPLTLEEFIELSQVLWEEIEERNVPKYLQKEIEILSVAD